MSDIRVRNHGVGRYTEKAFFTTLSIRVTNQEGEVVDEFHPVCLPKSQAKEEGPEIVMSEWIAERKEEEIAEKLGAKLVEILVIPF